ncbi:unnamed protein product [Gordionus sp. m RMFG-2023]
MDQRGSGQVVTYALNTITNTKIQLGRCLKSEGILNEVRLLYENGKNPNAAENLVVNWLDTQGKNSLDQMMIAGDDVVVGRQDDTFARALTYLAETGKLRKDIEQFVPSKVYNWEQVEFCSHHFHSLDDIYGRNLIVPDRHQNEIIGRARVQKGGLANIRESTCLAKAYSQMWLLYYFHRRDIRLSAFAINSVVPINSKTRMELHVWNRVWIIDNPWIEDKRTIDSWDKIPYLPKDWDGSFHVKSITFRPTPFDFDEKS